MPSSSQIPSHGPEQHPRRQHDPQRGVGWLNRFFRKIVGPAQLHTTSPGVYFEHSTHRHQQLAAMGFEMRTDPNGYPYVVKRVEPPESADESDEAAQPPHPGDAAAD